MSSPKKDTPQKKVNIPYYKTPKHKKRKRKSAVFELIYGLICILVTATFCLAPIFLFAKSGALTFNFAQGYAFYRTWIEESRLHCFQGKLLAE